MSAEFKNWWRRSSFWKHRSFKCFFFGMGYCLVKRFENDWEAGVTFFIFNVESKTLLNKTRKYVQIHIKGDTHFMKDPYHEVYVDPQLTCDFPVVLHKCVGFEDDEKKSVSLILPMTDKVKNLVRALLLVHLPQCLSVFVLDYFSTPPQNFSSKAALECWLCHFPKY